MGQTQVTVEELQIKLRRSEESRRRAWNALQLLRTTVETLANAPLIHPPKPVFDAEAESIQRGVIQLISTLVHAKSHLEKAVEHIRPFISNRNGDPGFPHALMNLNRALPTDGMDDAELARRIQALHAKPNS